MRACMYVRSYISVHMCHMHDEAFASVTACMYVPAVELALHGPLTTKTTGGACEPPDFPACQLQPYTAIRKDDIFVLPRPSTAEAGIQPSFLHSGWWAARTCRSFKTA